MGSKESWKVETWGSHSEVNKVFAASMRRHATRSVYVFGNCRKHLYSILVDNLTSNIVSDVMSELSKDTL